MSVSDNVDPLAPWRRKAGDSASTGDAGATDLVTFEVSNYRLSLPYSSLAYAILDTSAERNGHTIEELKLAFSSHIVTIWGKRLAQLQEPLCTRSVAIVRQAPSSASMLQEDGPVVSELKWVEVRSDLDA